MQNLNKIVYFDRETINNILQEMNKGTKVIERGSMTSLRGNGQLEVDAQVKLSVPLIKRIAFLFSGKISVLQLEKSAIKDRLDTAVLMENDGIF